MKKSIPFCIVFLSFLSCVNFTPKPKGSLRVEPDAHHYALLSEDDLPYSFQVSQYAVIELPPIGDPDTWITIAYPQLNVRVYCTYLPITRTTFSEVFHESYSLLLRQAKQPITKLVYERPEDAVYGTLFTVDGEAASPLQFLLTDSVSHFFRGALYYEAGFDADSLAPVTAYLREDIVELMQTFRWRK